jgi:predicted glycoside hydrolase/deacetylase ChbG (UPF0249 family)
MRALIVNADDFGLSVGINKGIMRGYQLGVITSTSAMVNFPAWEQGVRLLTGNPGLGVGLHVNISRGRPLSNSADIPSLVNRDGLFHGAPELLLQANPDHILREMYAQYCRFVKLRRQPPTHLDSHHHMHCWPGIDQLFVLFAQERGLPLGYLPPREYRKELCTPDAYIWQFFDRGANQPNFIRLMEGVRTGTTQFLCHPGQVSPDLSNWSAYTWQRERELAILCSYTRNSFQERYGIHLVNFQALA